MKMRFIERENALIAYNPKTMRFFEVNKRTRSLMEAVENGVPDETIIEEFDTDTATLNKVKLIMRGAQEPKTVPPVQGKQMGLEKLVLNISNACNLRCRYCYANGGNYMSDESMMSEQVAKDALDLFYDRFKEIGVIQLFGGEPLMNVPLVKYVCDYVVSHGKNTRIGIVTNGTLINDAFIEMVKKYNMLVTISYDGVPLVNDIMRITKSGHGTSDIILRNVKKLREATGQPSTLEVTYNQKHVDNAIRICDIISFIRKNVGDIPLHITAAGGSKTCDFVLHSRDEFVRAVDDVFDNTENLTLFNFSFVQRIIKSLQSRQGTEYLCKAGLNTLSVSVDGDVYPCFMFTDDKAMKMGNIYDEALFESDTFKAMRTRLVHFSKNDIPECKDCFIKESCFGCLGLNLLETGSVFKLNKESCDMYRNMTEQVIYRLYMLKKERAGYGIAG